MDESRSLLKGQRELRPSLTHKWHCQTVTADGESINPWALQAGLVLSWSNPEFGYLEVPTVLYKPRTALSKIWKLCLLLLWSQDHLELILSSLPLPLTSFTEMKEVKTISSLGNSIMWKGGGCLINTHGLWSQLEGQIFVSQMEWCLLVPEALQVRTIVIQPFTSGKLKDAILIFSSSELEYLLDIIHPVVIGVKGLIRETCPSFNYAQLCKAEPAPASCSPSPEVFSLRLFHSIKSLTPFKPITSSARAFLAPSPRWH